jgi:hypothetical protein
MPKDKNELNELSIVLTDEQSERIEELMWSEKLTYERAFELFFKPKPIQAPVIVPDIRNSQLNSATAPSSPWQGLNEWQKSAIELGIPWHYFIGDTWFDSENHLKAFQYLLALGYRPTIAIAILYQFLLVDEVANLSADEIDFNVRMLDPESLGLNPTLSNDILNGKQQIDKYLMVAGKKLGPSEKRELTLYEQYVQAISARVEAETAWLAAVRAITPVAEDEKVALTIEEAMAQHAAQEARKISVPEYQQYLEAKAELTEIEKHRLPTRLLPEGCRFVPCASDASKDLEFWPKQTVTTFYKKGLLCHFWQPDVLDSEESDVVANYANTERSLSDVTVEQPGKRKWSC